MPNTTAATTTTIRATIDAMWTLTIDCRCETCSDGMTRYQWPRIIAVHAPPSSSAELKKLAIVIACEGNPDTCAIAWANSATAPAATPVPTMNGRIDAMTRPTVSQYSTSEASKTTSATSDVVPA